MAVTAPSNEPGEGRFALPGLRASQLGAVLGAFAATIGVAAFLVAPQPLSVPFAAAGVAGGAAAIGMVATTWRRARRMAFEAAILRDGLETTQAAYLITGPEGRIVLANEALARLVGVPEPDLAAVERLLADDPPTLERFRRLRAGAEKGTATSAEIERRRPDGTVVRWTLTARPLPRGRGYVSWRLEDVTAQRQTEAALREEQRKLVDFLDQAPVGFYSVDQDGRFLFVNATLADWLGVEAAELTRGTLRLHDFLVEPPTGGEPYDLTPRSSDSGDEPVLMRSRQGRSFRASVTQTLVEAADGASLWTRSVVRDLTQERQIREALRASEVRFKRFFEDAPIGVAQLDQAGRLIEWNRAFEKLVGVPGGDLAGQAIGTFLAEQEEVAERLSRVLAGAEVDAPLEVKLRGKSDLVVSLFVKRLETSPDEPPALILQFIDQTEQRRLETQVSQSQKMQAIGQLAGGIAHDFNNLLTAMIGFCDLLLLRHKAGDSSFGDIMQIKQNANRAANLVRQLLAFSRQQTLQPRILNVTDVLAELSNLLRRLIGENIELQMVHGRDLGLVKVDQGQLEQVIINMAVNARDAMPNGGRLTIRTSNIRTEASLRRGSEEMPPGSYVMLEVLDTGIGIPAENLDRIFEPFFSTKEVGSGTGLGLSTVYGIVRQTGGYVFVDSKLGGGTRFHVYLPALQESKAEEVPDAARDKGPGDLTGRGSILLVEDEDPVRLFGARALRNKGYDVLEAKSGEEALKLLTESEVELNLLITDVIMPKMDGPELIRRVRELKPDLKVICISGYAEDRFRQRLEGNEVIHFLAKPFSLKQLAAKVKDVLRGGE